MSDSTFSFEQLNGKVVTAQGAKVENVTEAVKGKGVMLYFSAHWCPPCRTFTPTLAEFYTKHHESQNFEIIFVSFDRTEASFKEYAAEMPWPIIEFNDDTREIRDHLGNHFSVNGIPRLVLLGDDAVVKIDSVKSLVTSKPDEYPWPQQSKTDTN